jgi:mediator of replication checkpoint protein 1
MASTRGSSPASELSPNSPLQLTPNSKVKALMASFDDDDSDESSVSDTARARLRAAFTKKSSITAVDPTKQSTSSPQMAAEESDDEDEEDIVRPKGRMAGRMLANTESSSAEREQSANDATRNLSPKSAEQEDVEDSENNDVPIISRKRKIRSPRRATPISSPRNTTASPGLFVSPSKPRSGTPADIGSDSDSEDLPVTVDTTTDRFKALVEKKRKERQDREAEETAEKARKRAEWKSRTTVVEEEDVEMLLTQQNSSTRKASKKAKEDIARETQRLARNTQLTYKPVTKKKITKTDFFKRMNYKITAAEEEGPGQSFTSLTSSSPIRHSDTALQETPPTSPASVQEDLVKETTVVNALNIPNLFEENDGEHLPTLENDMAISPFKKLEAGQGKGKAVEIPEASPEPQKSKKKYTFKQPPIRIRLPKAGDKNPSTLTDSESDLEVVSEISDPRKQKLDLIFGRVPEKQAKQSHALHVLKTLSHLTSPGKNNFGRNKKPSVTTTELQVSLQQKARQQALREREERVQALRDRGVIIPTAEERQKEMAEVEDLISKARRENDVIGQRERAEAKKERKANGEVDPLGDSSDDEDWEEEKETLAGELSGSDVEGDESDDGNEASGEEDEDEEDVMELDGEQETTAPNPLCDNEADETDEDEAEADISMDETTAELAEPEDDEEDHELTVMPINRRPRKANVISDDEDDDENSIMETPLAPKFNSPMQLNTHSPAAPNSVFRSATKTFIPGITAAGPVGLGLTQIFAGTMDESQLDHYEPPTAPAPESPQIERRSDAMSFLKRLTVPELPPFVPTPVEDSQDVIMNSQAQLDQIPESQTMESQTQGIQLGFSQSQIHGFDSLMNTQASQMSEFPEATQDVGFQHMTPIRGRFVDAPPSTVDTVVLRPSETPEDREETPVVKKKGKLRRRAPLIAEFSDEENAEDAEAATIEDVEDEFDISANAFDVMRKASKKRVVINEFDKKKSDAKNMVNEQAEESEDEYAGLGGASDDESGGEDDQFVREMIDDEGGKDLDERKVAAFFA